MVLYEIHFRNTSFTSLFKTSSTIPPTLLSFCTSLLFCITFFKSFTTPLLPSIPHLSIYFYFILSSSSSRPSPLPLPLHSFFTLPPTWLSPPPLPSTLHSFFTLPPTWLSLPPLPHSSFLLHLSSNLAFTTSFTSHFIPSSPFLQLGFHHLLYLTLLFLLYRSSNLAFTNSLPHTLFLLSSNLAFTTSFAEHFVPSLLFHQLGLHPTPDPEFEFLPPLPLAEVTAVNSSQLKRVCQVAGQHRPASSPIHRPTLPICRNTLSNTYAYLPLYICLLSPIHRLPSPIHRPSLPYTLTLTSLYIGLPCPIPGK